MKHIHVVNPDHSGTGFFDTQEDDYANWMVDGGWWKLEVRGWEKKIYLLSSNF